MTEALRQALVNYLDKMRPEYNKLLSREIADVDDARRNHGSIAESSWQSRLRAERRIKAATNLLEALGSEDETTVSPVG